MDQHEPTGVITSIFGKPGANKGKEAPSALNFLNRIPLRKVVIWASFLGLIYLLRDFFGVLIGTFVISYIGNSIISRFEKNFKNRKLLVVAYFLTIISMMTGFGFWIVTLAIDEGKVAVEKIQNDDPYEFVYKELYKSLPPKIFVRVKDAVIESHQLNESAPKNGKDGSKPHGDAHNEVTPPVKDPKKEPEKSSKDKKAPDKKIVQSNPEKDKDKAIAGKDGEKKDEFDKEEAQRFGDALQHLLKDYTKLAIKMITKFVGSITKSVLQVLISLIFSFMIIWDLPGIKKGLRSLHLSRLGEAYSEVAPSVVNFGELLGKAFQAQTIIALVNTAFTAVGLLIIGVDKGVGFLSIVVFICSFIPVAGVFISTLPMALVAFYTNGLGSALAVVVMVMVVHAIEAYILNPQIYSAHLKLHPLVVLVVLVVAEHTVGVWGLVVAVPFTVYIFKHVIMDGDKLDRTTTSVDLTG
ncbi:MAG: AI-2E family transporter [Planctomycetota bacterium]|nr:AI-2E family transporter [Planctomycetota bacterium]